MKISVPLVSKALFLSLSLAFFPAISHATPVRAAVGKELPRRAVTGANIRFLYQTFDGEFQTVCKHRLVSEASPYDWTVECFRGTDRFAVYTAHIALTQYPLSGRTKLSIELLYWLNGTRLPSEVGSTTWFHFSEMAPLQGISTSQTVENGSAGLYLEIGPEAVRAARLARGSIRR